MAAQIRSGQAGSNHDNVRIGNVRSRLGRLGQLKVRTSQIMSRQDRLRTGQAMLYLFISDKIMSDPVRTGKVRVRSGRVWSSENRVTVRSGQVTLMSDELR